MRKTSTLIAVALSTVLAAGLLVYLVVRPSSPPITGPADPTGSVTSRPVPTGVAGGSPRPIPTDVGLSAPLPLGEVTAATFSEGDPCPEGSTCERFEVTCPGVREPARVTVSTAPPTGEPRGVALFLSGGGGRNWWADEGSTATFIDRVRRDGLAVVQLRWKDEWLGSASGEQVGPHVLACRPATAIEHVHRTIHLESRSTPGDNEAAGACGFCVTGASGGASQLGYALAFYGLEGIIDAAIPTGGPPHAALDRGCGRDPADEAYWFEGASTQTIDTSWGFRGGGGPCVSNDESWTARWRQASVDLGGSDYVHPDTRVHVIVGGRDRVLPHAEDYVARLRAEGSPRVELEIVPGMGHSIAGSPDGLAVLRRVLLA